MLGLLGHFRRVQRFPGVFAWHDWQSGHFGIARLARRRGAGFWSVTGFCFFPGSGDLRRLWEADFFGASITGIEVDVSDYAFIGGLGENQELITSGNHGTKTIIKWNLLGDLA